MRRLVMGHWFGVVVLFGVCMLTSCRTDIVYSRFYPIQSGEWHADSVPSFDYTISDAKAGYTMLLYVRHTERYPYQNMWLFVDNAGRRDTIEFYLADDRGRWLGNQHHGFIEMPVLMEENIHFPDTGSYRLSVQHAMRDTLLRGVADVGLIVKVKSEK